jgi:hypothetical protein
MKLDKPHKEYSLNFIIRRSEKIPAEKKDQLVTQRIEHSV